MSNDNENASRPGIIKYLTDHYDVDSEQATLLVDKHKEIVDKAMRVMSFNYYPGDRIAAAEELISTDDDDDDDEDE